MIIGRNYDFRNVTMGDLPMLLEWQRQPHVRVWWDSGEPYGKEALSDHRVSRFIVSFETHPFAFMQDYSVHGWEGHHFAHLPKGARGIDQYIGEPKMIGIGHGSAFIGARMNVLFEGGAPVIATNPHPDNERAIAVYRKLGFEQSGPPEETQWGRVLPMIAKR